MPEKEISPAKGDMYYVRQVFCAKCALSNLPVCGMLKREGCPKGHTLCSPNTWACKEADCNATVRMGTLSAKLPGKGSAGKECSNMQIKQITACMFSPRGTTRRTVMAAAREMGKEVQEIDLLREQPKEKTSFAPDSLLVVGVPVYAGRIPGVCLPPLRRLCGRGTPAIALAVYGNRAYEDALLELCDVLQEGGFFVPAAGAFLAQHSIFDKVAAGRPDQADLEKIVAFAQRAAALVEQLPEGAAPTVQVPGNRPYRTPSSVPLKPSAGRSCTKCGACVQWCPTGSIPADNPAQTTTKTCISCGACIHHCPNGARSFGGAAYLAAAAVFAQKNSKRREPESFFCTL